MPNPATDKLLKILRLEAQTNYADKAVTRGLASFSSTWLADAARNNIDPDWAEGVAQTMRDYSANTDAAQRRAVLDVLMTRLKNPENRRQETGVRSQKSEVGTHDEVVAPWEEAVAVAPSQAPSTEKPEPPPTQRKTQDARPTQQPKPQRPIPNPQTPITQTYRPPQPETRAPIKPSAYTPPPGAGLDAPVTKISGIGDMNAQKLAKLGVQTIQDLLYFFPTRYDDYSALKTINQLEYGQQVTIIGKVASTRRQRMKTGAFIFRAIIEDASGMIECSWFTTDRFVDSLAKNFPEGREVVISGKVNEYMGRLVFQQPNHEPAEREWVSGGNIVPVYRLTEGLQPLLLRRVMKRVSEYWSQRVTEYLPESVKRGANLINLSEALQQIHFPKDPRTQEQARRRLAFDELFVLQVAIQQQRMAWRGEAAQALRVGEPTVDRLMNAMPFKLTGAQQRAIRRVHEDLRKPYAMHRLLQGDVGAGKTAVAAVAMAAAASGSAQSAMMAPTEILAEQHFKSLSKLFGAMGDVVEAEGYANPRPISMALLTGSTKAAERKQIYAGLSDGSIHVVVGTHALIQDAVEFKNLGFVCIDEQHRFGVQQRTALRQKGKDFSPHTLVMTATPIPRTLALTLYGDLDNTILDEMPPGRQPITTHWFTPAERERAYAFVRSQVDAGRQVFVICPLVQESDKVEAKAAVEEHARLQKEVFPKYKLGLLHGRMKGAEKEEVMGAFGRNEYQILVSTSVVEVGIDVPNATVMMIEGANRFGLSQLHQFRGRVGRGEHASYCLLIADSTSDVSDERLQAIVATQDGFKLAEKDLEIRGPGEFFGTKQSGDPELKLVNFRDRDLLERAREQAERIAGADPELNAPEHGLLAQKVNAFWSARQESKGDAS
jgi:ATP-dependent DNA helicase RecG